MAKAAMHAARVSAARRMALAKASPDESSGSRTELSPYQELLDVVTYRRGDLICHKTSGQEFKVDYVQVAGRQLHIVTSGEFREKFHERDIVKVTLG